MKKILFTSLAVLGLGITGCSNEDLGVAKSGKKYLSKLRDMEMPEILEHLYGIKVCVCKACGGHKEASEGDFDGISAYGIRMGKNDEVFAYQPQNIKEMYSSYWTKVKAQ